MKKLSSRMIALLTNAALVLIVFVVGVVCFLPSVSAASGVDDRVHYKGNSKDGVSLMFNVYWGTEIVYDILGVLEEHGVKATFFIGGSWADYNVKCLRTIAEKGHEIASHGYFHRDHDKLTLKENREEIKSSIDFLNLACGAEVTLFAPPSGAFNDDTLTAAEELGLKTIMWSKDTIDWRDKDRDTVYRRATDGAEGGDLVLMHPMAHTKAALGDILDYYATHGLRAITVSENLS